MRAGKDYVAEKTGFEVIQLSKPIIMLMDRLFGSMTWSKSDPGVRQTLQRIGQLGRGIISEDYPMSTERLSFMETVRAIGPTIPQMMIVEWDKFGQLPNFWTQALFDILPSTLTRSVVVPNCRFEEDVKDFITEGWDVYLVLCSERERKRRFEDEGEVYDGIHRLQDVRPISEEHLRIDISERLSTHTSNYLLYPSHFKDEVPFPMDRVVWNDPEDPPKGSILARDSGWLTVDDFSRRFKESQEQTL